MMRHGLRLGPFALAWAALLFAAPPAAADVTMTLAEEFPLKRHPVEVRLDGLEPGAAYEVHVTYRPNSETAREELVGTVAGDAPSATLAWTPADAGITAVRVMSGGEQVLSQNYAVRFDKAPLSGILIFLGAGVLLFGGATTAMRRALEA